MSLLLDGISKLLGDHFSLGSMVIFFGLILYWIYQYFEYPKILQKHTSEIDFKNFLKNLYDTVTFSDETTTKTKTGAARYEFLTSSRMRWIIFVIVLGVLWQLDYQHVNIFALLAGFLLIFEERGAIQSAAEIAGDLRVPISIILTIFCGVYILRVLGILN